MSMLEVVMQRLIIQGGNILRGTIKISGAKNSAVALIPAAILCDEEVIIDNVPQITDCVVLTEILKYLGATVIFDEGKMCIDSRNIVNREIPEAIAKKLRASYYFMGALLGKYKKVEIYFPGGCAIGVRPIDLHLKGFAALGAKIETKGNKYEIKATELRGANIYLDIASVGATINIMLAAVRAQGKTIIENAAQEPEIVNVATFLNNMGAKITGAGTNRIIINGVAWLGRSFHEVIPDRIEAGTYMIAAALIGQNVKIAAVIPEHLEALVSKLKEMGVKVEEGNNYFIVSAVPKLKNVKIKTLDYPGFPTDLQQPLSVLLTQSEGVSIIKETIYENRFQNLKYLKQMGANIECEQERALIKGPTPLVGREVTATDLRAGACLILAGLIADGETIINNIEYVLRGYEDIVTKLTNLGAKIKIE